MTLAADITQAGVEGTRDRLLVTEAQHAARQTTEAIPNALVLDVIALGV